MRKALIILHPNFEEIEAITPIDLLSRAEISVTIAYIGDSPRVTGRSGIELTAQQSLESIQPADYDAVILPGGPGINDIRSHPEICRLLKAFHQQDKLVACICAAPLLLKDAQILEPSTTYTAFPATQDELKINNHNDVEIDQNIITGKAAGSSIKFALSIISYLASPTLSAEIADSIHWKQ